MISVSPVSVGALTDQQLKWLIAYSHKCPEPFHIGVVLEGMQRKELMLYSMHGDVNGIFLLGIGHGGLMLNTVAGNGIVKHFVEVYETIKRIAAAAGAKALYTYTGRPALDRLMARTKATPLMMLYKETL